MGNSGPNFSNDGKGMWLGTAAPEVTLLVK